MDTEAIPSPSELRKQRGLVIAKTARLKKVVASTWLVPSQTGTGGYLVDAEHGTCTCPDHELRGVLLKCKHRWAVEFARHRVTVDGSVVVDTMRITYTQDWPRYNAAQCSEKEQVQLLLHSLCQGVASPPQIGRGRRQTPLSDVIFAATLKTFVGMSGRRASSDIRAAAERGLIDKPVAYNTIFDYLGRAELEPILEELVRISALPLASVETRFAIDGTGFGSKVYKRWFDAKYGRQMKEATWVKLHAVCGTVTNIITAAKITEATKSDSPELPELVCETAEGFPVEEVLGDKGYLGVKNMEAIERVGGTPYIAFKDNSVVGPKSRDAWRRAYHFFAFHREAWLEHYSKRSRIESVFSAMKRLTGPAVRARTHQGMVNEVLTKCLAYNLSRLVHAVHELGIQPEFWSTMLPTVGAER